MMKNWLMAIFLMAAEMAGRSTAEEPPKRSYENRLRPVANPQPLLAGAPEFLEPLEETARLEAPPLVDEPGADLEVRAWRFSYNARAVIEIPNRLEAARTAVIVVHPWGVDDGGGWQTPEPAGAAFFCTPEKNRFGLRHMEKVVNPFLKSLRGKAGLVAYSLPGREDPIRKKIYRSFRGRPSSAERAQGLAELEARLRSFPYRGEAIPERLLVSAETPVVDYFKQFPGLDAGDRYDPAGFWNLPIPVARPLEVDPEDVVIYDGEGYEALRRFLKDEKIRHVLLCGYCTDMCYASTTAGYQNLSKDFNVFLVGDASLATYPASRSPRAATAAALAFASLNQLVTQVSWIKIRQSAAAR